MKTDQGGDRSTRSRSLNCSEARTHNDGSPVTTMLCELYNLAKFRRRR